MSRRDDGPLVEILVGLSELPFWMSLVAGGVFFVSLTYLPPLLAGSSVSGGIFARVLPAFAPWLLGACLFAGLVGVVKRLYRRQLLSRSRELDGIRKLTWAELELMVGQAYRGQQYAVTERGGAKPDGGIDLELRRDGDRVLVQCKQWKRQVPVEKVRELLGVVTGEGADRGVLVAPGGFTRAARDFARGKPIELLDGEGLLKLDRGTRAA